GVMRTGAARARLNANAGSVAFVQSRVQLVEAIARLIEHGCGRDLRSFQHSEAVRQERSSFACTSLTEQASAEQAAEVRRAPVARPEGAFERGDQLAQNRLGDRGLAGLGENSGDRVEITIQDGIGCLTATV